MGQIDRHNSSCSLSLKKIFRCMMEEGYHPSYETSHIIFELGDNLAVVEYENSILSVRLFFTIEEEMAQTIINVSNSVMTESQMVKPTVLDDMKNLMFSCETMGENIRQFRSFFPKAIELLGEAWSIHRKEMKIMILHKSVLNQDLDSHEQKYDSPDQLRKTLVS